jgi:hypothetical protein
MAPFFSKVTGRGMYQMEEWGVKAGKGHSTLTRRFRTIPLPLGEGGAKRRVSVEVLLPFGLGFNLQLDMSRDVFEQTDGNGELAERLDVILHVDLALLDLESLGFE